MSACCVAYALITIIKGALRAALAISVGAAVSGDVLWRIRAYTYVQAHTCSADVRARACRLTTITMTATVVDQPDKQEHQQQDQEHTSKQHLPQQLQPEHDNVVASMEGTDDEVAVAVSRDIPIDASHQATAEQGPTEQQHHSERIPDPGILSASASAPHAKTKKPRRRRGGKGRWKPYRTLSLKEKIVQEEKEERNAVEKRERLFSRGKPMAPYNTTQFLLEDHEKRTMPPDVGDSLPGMTAHQRQSTAGFSPTHERRCLQLC
uniref:Homeobox domain-containing protein n=1 Tax=Loa loa TaxID=7209 RepID=A0A1I7VU15_LOALO